MVGWTLNRRSLREFGERFTELTYNLIHNIAGSVAIVEKFDIGINLNIISPLDWAEKQADEKTKGAAAVLVILGTVFLLVLTSSAYQIFRSYASKGSYHALDDDQDPQAANSLE